MRFNTRFECIFLNFNLFLYHFNIFLLWYSKFLVKCRFWPICLIKRLSWPCLIDNLCPTVFLIFSYHFSIFCYKGPNYYFNLYSSILSKRPLAPRKYALSKYKGLMHISSLSGTRELNWLMHHRRTIELFPNCDLVKRLAIYYSLIVRWN